MADDLAALPGPGPITRVARDLPRHDESSTRKRQPAPRRPAPPAPPPDEAAPAAPEEEAPRPGVGTRLNVRA